MLELLKAHDNQLTYQEITRWAKISIKNVTSKIQTPRISVQGEGKMKVDSPWLNLPISNEPRNGALILYNEVDGWTLTQGKVLGVDKNSLVYLKHNGKEIELKVTEADLDTSKIEDPIEDGIHLEKTKTYDVNVLSNVAPLALYVNNIDGLEDTESLIKDILKKYIVTDSSKANYYVNIFNQMVYYSLPDLVFQPLTSQIDLLTEERAFENLLTGQLKYLVKWNHFDTLENPDKDFDKAPIRIELQIKGEDKWHDITNGEFFMEAMPNRYERTRPGTSLVEKFWIQAYKIRVTNLHFEPLNIGAFTLNSDLSIDTMPFDDRVIKLNPGRSHLFFEHKNQPYGVTTFNVYKEIYNWKYEWLNYKFIVNDYQDFTDALKDYRQPSPGAPQTISPISKEIEITRSGLSLDDLEEVKKRWGTVKTTLRLKNPEYNIISGELLEYWDAYQNSPELGPFMSKLYFEQKLDGLILSTDSYPNRTGEDQNQKNLFFTTLMHTGNLIDNNRRKRNFKKAKRKMYNKPVIVAEGDSWFLYPIKLRDIVDCVMAKYPVRSIAAAGDELQNYQKTGQLLETVAEERPKYVLISGGGNDVIGKEIKELLASPSNPDSNNVKDFLKLDNFNKTMDNLRKLYVYFITNLKQHNSVEQVFVHGYDYIRTDLEQKMMDKGWVNKYLTEAVGGKDDPAKRTMVIKYLVDSFNEILIDLSENDDFVTYIDLRNKVEQYQWYDEIHPNDVGFSTLGDLFLDAIEKQEAS